MEEGIYRMECETAGSAGNRELGTLVPIDYIQGLTRAELTGIIMDGSDEEPTEALLERYLTRYRSLPPVAIGMIITTGPWSVRA